MTENDAVDRAALLQPAQYIQVVHYTTSPLNPEDRYAAWYRRDWPRTRPIYQTEPIEPFDTRWDMAQLGQVTFVYTEITAMRWERRLQDIRTSDFDPIVVNLMIEGRAYGDMDGRAFDEPAGTFHFHDLARPSLHVSTASKSYGFIIPRPVAEERFAPLHDLHGLVVEGASAKLMFALADQVLDGLEHLTVDQADGLGRVFLEMLGVALAAARPKRTPFADALRRRAVEAIDHRLGARDVSVEELCRVLQVSRGRLFRAFQADGGVQSYILTERLARARTALAEVERAEPIGVLAHRLGFSDTSHLSRAFKQRFGMTPKEYRALVAQNRQLQAELGDGTLMPI